MKFVHTADWQLGKAFGCFDPDVRAALNDSRCNAINTIGAGSKPWIPNDQRVYSYDAQLYLMIEISAEAAKRMQGILLTSRDHAFCHVPSSRLAITETAA